MPREGASAAQAVHFLAHDAPAPVLALLDDMGVRRLEDHDVCELFVLPTFSSLASSKQRAVREHLLRHWHAFRQHDRLREALRTTPFVPVGERLLRPSEVLDPRVDVLSYIFGGESVFPEAECCTDEWLAMLAALGMRTSIDRNTFLECARKVRCSCAPSHSMQVPSTASLQLGPPLQHASAQHGVLPSPSPLSPLSQVQQLGGAQPFGTPRAEAPPTPDVLSRAALLTSHLIAHFGALTSTAEDDDDGNDGGDDDAARATGAADRSPSASISISISISSFCASLSRVRFIPSHAPSAGVAAHAGEPTLACFAELALHQVR